MDETVLLTAGEGGTDMVSTDAAVRADLAKVAAPQGKISRLDSVSVLTCAGLKANMLEAVGKGFFWKEQDASIVLPTNIKRLSYIRSTGTQRIDTGLVPNINTRIEIEGEFSSGTVHLGNVPYGTSNGMYWILDNSSGPSYFGNGYVDIIKNNVHMTGTLGTVYKIRIDKTGFYVNEQLSAEWKITPTVMTAKTNLLLFGSTGGSYNTPTDIYYSCNIYDGDNLVREYIPAKDIITGECGLFDVINNRFDANISSEKFIEGDEIYIDDLSYYQNMAPWISSSMKNEAILSRTNYGKLYNTSIRQGVFLPGTSPENEYFTVLSRLHKMYESLLICNVNKDLREIVVKYSIGPSGTQVLSTIESIINCFNMYADLDECNKLRLEVSDKLFETDFGTESVSEKITDGFYSLIPIEIDSRSSIKSDEVRNARITTGASATFNYNYCDKYELSLNLSVVKTDKTNGNEIGRSTLSVSRIYDSDTLRSSLTLPGTMSYSVKNGVLYKDKNIFAYGVVNTTNRFVLLRNGAILDLEDDSLEPNIKLASNLLLIKYIQSTGSQRIDTGIYPTINTRIEIKGEFLSGNVHLGNVSYGASQNGIVWILDNSSDASYFGDGRVDIVKTNVGMTGTQGVIYDICIDKNGFKVNGITKASWKSTPTTMYSDHSLFIFGTVGGSYNAPADKFYRCTIYDNDDIVCDLVPVIRNDGVVGMYDYLTDRFLENVGTGIFIGGEVITE